MASFTERMIGAARLDAAIYNEVEADQTATGPAMLVVVLSSLAAGIGAGEAGAVAMVIAAVIALVGWGVWAGVVFLVGTKILAEAQTRADWGELLRTIGFSTSPGLLRVVGLVPGLGPLLNFLVGLWMLAAMVVAVREALDYSGTGRAVAVCVIGFFIYLAVTVVLAMLLGVTALGIGALAGATAG